MLRPIVGVGELAVVISLIRADRQPELLEVVWTVGVGRRYARTRERDDKKSQDKQRQENGHTHQLISARTTHQQTTVLVSTYTIGGRSRLTVRVTLRVRRQHVGAR